MGYKDLDGIDKDAVREAPLHDDFGTERRVLSRLGFSGDEIYDYEVAVLDAARGSDALTVEDMQAMAAGDPQDPTRIRDVKIPILESLLAQKNLSFDDFDETLTKIEAGISDEKEDRAHNLEGVTRIGIQSVLDSAEGLSPAEEFSALWAEINLVCQDEMSLMEFVSAKLRKDLASYLDNAGQLSAESAKKFLDEYEGFGNPLDELRRALQDRRAVRVAIPPSLSPEMDLDREPEFLRRRFRRRIEDACMWVVDSANSLQDSSLSQADIEALSGELAELKQSFPGQDLKDMAELESLARDFYQQAEKKISAWVLRTNGLNNSHAKLLKADLYGEVLEEA